MWLSGLDDCREADGAVGRVDWPGVMFCCWLAEVGVQMNSVTCFVLPDQRDSFGTRLSGVLVLGEKKMKFLLSLLLIVGLVGCGDGASSPNGDAAQANPQPQSDAKSDDQPNTETDAKP